MVDGNTRICGLIGDPVSHTLSPLIHNTVSKQFGHNNLYVPFQVKKWELQQTVRGAYALNILGLNITFPYKNQVISSLVEIDDITSKIGAVNTLVRCHGGYKGYNTDMLGLFKALSSDEIVIEDNDVIILGAARAAAFMCALNKAKSVYLLNRTFEKSKIIANEVNNFFNREYIFPIKLSDYSKLPNKKFLAIQATNVGLYPDINQLVIDDKAFYEKIHTGYDLIYKPRNTLFMQNVKKNGGKA